MWRGAQGAVECFQAFVLFTGRENVSSMSRVHWFTTLLLAVQPGVSVCK
jgi:hypothetical protein